MKLALACVLTLLTGAVLAAGVPKEVCRVEKDKAGKEKKVCRTILVHKKLEGTKVPPVK